ncbi:hypothetical protein MPSEU_000698100 [Mayamaea pseudoterrestris]|nr:hypothetical protein MPSEU_000698100 [Mayamaea pseudoterrestris]
MNWKWAISLIPAILATFAFLTSFLFSFWCQSVAFVPDDAAANLQTIRIGPWSAAILTNATAGGTQYYVQQSYCASFPRGALDADAKLKTVRAFGIIVLIVGGLLVWFLYLAPCLYFVNEKTWKLVAIIFIVILTLFQGLTFLIFRSSFCTNNSILNAYGLTDSYAAECVWDQGSTANVIATLLWFLTGVVMLRNGAPKRPARPPPETQTVTYERTELPDGNSTVAEVGVVKGTAVPSPSLERPVDEKA